ncbi:MAG: plasmid mobilization relaxosome protein MobC, partial [Pseudomonadota bacterium]
RAAYFEMRPVHYARAVLLRDGDAPLPPPVPQMDRLVYEQLKRLGNNLNQILRHLHITRGQAPPSLEPLLKDIRAVLDRGAILGP